MWQFLKSCALAAGLALGGFALAGASQLVLLTNQTIINPSVLADLNNVINTINSSLGLNSINAITTTPPEGYIWRQVGPIYSTTATTLTTLVSYTLPGGSFDAPFRTIKIHTAFHSADTPGTNKTYNCSFSSISLTSATVADSGLKGGGYCDLLVTEGLTANTQMVSGLMVWGSTPEIVTLAPATQTGTTSSGLTAWSGSLQGTGNAGDTIIDEFTVEYAN